MFSGTGNINVEWSQKTITVVKTDFAAGFKMLFSN